MDETFIQRLDKYMEYASLNDNKVTVQCGLTVGLINSARKRNKSLSGDNIGKILYVYQELNARWLLTGEGEMLCTPEDSAGNANFIAYLKEEKSKVEQQNHELNIQLREAVEKNAFLEGRISEIKKHVPEESNAICAIASGSDLELSLIHI